MKLPRFPRKALSIDFGSKEIKIVEGKYVKENIQIFKTITIEVEPHIYLNGIIRNKDALAQMIRDQLKENKIHTTATYGIINSSEIITREIIIPKVSREDIQAVVGYQIADYLPINIEDYVIQYLNLGNILEEDMEKVKVLLLAIPKDMVLSHLDLLREAGLKPEILDYQGNAMTKLLNLNDRVNQDYSTRDLAIALIDMGYSNSKLTIIKNGQIEVTRVIDTSSDDLSDDSRLSNVVRTSLADLCEEIEIVFRHYSTRKIGNMVNYILLQGGFSNIHEVDNIFSTYFDIPTMQLFTLDKIHWDGDLWRYANAIGGLIRIDGG